MPFFIDEDMWKDFDLDLKEGKNLMLMPGFRPLRGLEVKQERFTPEMENDIQELRKDLSTAKREILARHGIKPGAQAEAGEPGPLDLI